jgi:putative membrane protein
MMGPYGSFDGGMGWGGWLAMGFALVIFWGLVITGIVLLVRSLGHRHEVVAGPLGPTAAMRILDERFARGEIDADEYGRRRQLLGAA